MLANTPLWIEKLQPLTQSPKAIYKTVALSYLLPISLLAVYSSWLGVGTTSWSLFSAGLVAAVFGSIPLLFYLRQMEAPAAEPVPAAPPVEPDTQALDEAYEMLDQERSRAQELQRACLDLQETCEALEAEKEKLLQSRENDAKDREAALSDYQATIKEQRDALNRKQEYILKLENKVRDLSYEMKTVLQAHDSDPMEGSAGMDPARNHPVLEIFRDESLDEFNTSDWEDADSAVESRVQTPYDASVQLQKCLDTARKMTGANHLASDSPRRFLDFANESYAIDLRQLFDQFRDVSSCAIFLYSAKEQKLLFANNQVKALLGWSPEKFIQDFQSLVVEGLAEWKHATDENRPSGESQLRLLMKTKDSENLLVQCHLNVIPSGNFAGYIVGVLYAN